MSSILGAGDTMSAIVITTNRQKLTHKACILIVGKKKKRAMNEIKSYIRVMGGGETCGY